jgi:hypothetical protein
MGESIYGPQLLAFELGVIVWFGVVRFDHLSMSLKQGVWPSWQQLDGLF